MTHRGPFQPLLFCDSVIHLPGFADLSAALAAHVECPVLTSPE